MKITNSERLNVRQKRFDDRTGYLEVDTRLTLGEIAYILRLRSRKTLRQIALELGVTHTCVQNWECDRKGEVIKQIKYLREYLNNNDLKYLLNSFGIDLMEEA